MAACGGAMGERREQTGYRLPVHAIARRQVLE
jgi:hypothetical protein